MDIQRQGFPSIDQLADRYLRGNEKRAEVDSSESTVSFQKILEEKNQTAQEIHFSKHAFGRLQDRGIELSAEQMERLNDGVRKAKMKGIKDSLVIVDELAFIVNVPNQTVVTAMTGKDAEDKIFTNINGAVIN